jgi:hypothetical protein
MILSWIQSRKRSMTPVFHSMIKSQRWTTSKMMRTSTNNLVKLLSETLNFPLTLLVQTWASPIHLLRKSKPFTDSGTISRHGELSISMTSTMKTILIMQRIDIKSVGWRKKTNLVVLNMIRLKEKESLKWLKLLLRMIQDSSLNASRKKLNVKPKSKQRKMLVRLSGWRLKNARQKHNAPSK